MYPHQIDASYVGSYLDDLRRTNACARCKVRTETVFDRPSRIRTALSYMVDFVVIIVIGFVVVLWL